MEARLTPRVSWRPPPRRTARSGTSPRPPGVCDLSAPTAGRRGRPRAQAAASPALVRSRMRSRSNSARAANTCKTSLPPGVVVSTASCKLRNPMPWSARPVTVSTRCRRERPRRSSFHTTRVSPGRSWSRSCSRTGRSVWAPLAVSVNTPIAAGGLQRVDLELGVLVGGGDAGIAEQVSHAGDRLTTLRQRWLSDVDFGHGFWTGPRPVSRRLRRLSQKGALPATALNLLNRHPGREQSGIGLPSGNRPWAFAVKGMTGLGPVCAARWR
jgi:hypothetical protein